MALMEKLKIQRMTEREMDMTLLQTPIFGDEKGFVQVFRANFSCKSHEEALVKLFKKLNVPDLMPRDYEGRFMGTGDIVLIDECRNGQYYYQLRSGGWKSINRMLVR